LSAFSFASAPESDSQQQRLHQRAVLAIEEQVALHHHVRGGGPNRCGDEVRVAVPEQVDADA
jgi:hypothetical protein